MANNNYFNDGCANCNGRYDYSEIFVPDCSGCDDGCGGDKVFARTPDVNIEKCQKDRIKVAEIIHKNVYCSDKCVCPPVPIPTPTDCEDLPTYPIWEENGESVRIGCDLFKEEVDTNQCSPTYETVRLVDAIVINVVFSCN